MTKSQLKLRQWFRKRGWSVVDNNGGCGTVNLYRDPIEIDYFEFGYHDAITIKLFDSNGDYIYTTVSVDELKKLIELVEVCKIELESLRDNK